MKSGFVAIVGRPNAGKSTLLNQVLDTKLSIVTYKAQTTRERVLGIHTDDRGQIIFVDTPGIHKAKEGGINEFMVQEAREALEAPSAIWYLVDPRSQLKHEQPVLELLKKGGKAPVFLLMNKVDVLGKDARENVNRLKESIEAALNELKIPVHSARFLSAETGKGVKELLEQTWGLLPEGPLYYPDEEQISDRPTRFFVAEKIREQLYLQLGAEIPYSCAVEIESFEEDPKIPKIEATIHVERDSQKGMVIGKSGAKIKEIGSAAREQIEEFLGQKVFLGLKVKVLKDWTRDAQTLKKLGYNLPKPRKGRAS